MEELGKFIAPKGSSFPASPSQGQLCFRTDLGSLYYYDGYAWQARTEPLIWHDTTSYSGSFTATKEWEHTGGSSAEGILVLIIANSVTTPADEVTSVTYNGETLTELPKSPFSHAAGEEDAMIYAYFLSSPNSFASGMVKVTRTGTVAMAAVCITMGAPKGTRGLRASATSTKEAEFSLEPWLEIEPGDSRTLSYFALHSGCPSVGEVTINEITSRGRFLQQHDFGSQTAHFIQSGKPLEYLGYNDIELKQSSNPYGIFGVSIGPMRDFGLVASLPTSAGRGDTCQYIADKTNGVIWDLIYDGEGEYPWKKIGGPPLLEEVEASQALTSNTTFGNLATAGPSITLPLKGTYDVSTNFIAVSNAGTPDVGIMSYSIGATAAVLADATYGYPVTASLNTAEAMAPRLKRKTFIEAVKLEAKYRTNGSGTLQFANRVIMVNPVRVG